MKSRLTFYVRLLSKVIHDSSLPESLCSSNRDINYVESRVSNEGLGFLTVTLPSFGRHIVSCIESGTYTRFPAFKAGKRGLLPLFLQGWTRRIFTSEGILIPEFDPHILQEVLQVCMLFYKLEVPYAKRTEQKVLDSFRHVENELQHPSEEVCVDSSILGLARNLLSGVFTGFDFGDIEPAHGPGFVATGERGNGKYSFSRKYQRLHSKFPYYRYFSPSLSRVAFESGWYKRLLPQVNPIAKVALVPKDSRGPRLISMEPLELQWIQQGILRKLVPYIERHRIFRGQINFTDQSKNQQAALRASLSRDVATVDLKDASDRVSLSLVRSLFGSEVCEFLEACRSVATKLPSGEVLPLKKFAPMGSALCFPILSMSIWALVVATLRLNNLDTSKVLVYGDDLVVPTDSLPLVVNVLHSAGLLVNIDKTFHRSHFRESCGMDAYKGVQVTPLRVKKEFTGNRRDFRAYVHYIELSEAFFDKGLWSTVAFLRDEVRKVYGLIPWTHNRQYPGFYCPDIRVCSDRNYRFKRRYNRNLHRHEILVRTVRPRNSDSSICETGRMLKGLLGLYEFASENHRVALRGESVLRYSWCST